MSKAIRPAMVHDELPTLAERLERSTWPGFLMLNCARVLITTFLKDPLAVRDWQKFRHHAFANFWLIYGKPLSLELPGRTAELISSAQGVVLDIGPGDGSVVHLLDANKLQIVYGPEPAVDMHPKLVERVQAAGLADKYHPLACGAEPATLLPALAKAGVIKSDGSSSSSVDGIFDTIVSSRAFCSVAEPEKTAELLFKLLKPGGRLVFSEHVKSTWPERGTPLGWLVQNLYWALGWNFWMGGCTINRDTGRTLTLAGGQNGWKVIDIEHVGSWHPVPYIVGYLQKA